MSINVWVKLTILFTALCATLVAIMWLNQGHMKSFWTSLGFGGSQNRINWCEERVSTLHILETGAKLYEENGEWRWSQERNRPIDYLKIEKWFAKYCQINVEIIKEHPLEQPGPMFEAVFLNGERLTLYDYGHGGAYGDEVFRIRGTVFKSETLRHALKELLAFGDNIE